MVAPSNKLKNLFTSFAVKRRNRDRFPADFMFQLLEKEVVELNRSQFVPGSQFDSPSALLR